MKRYIRTLAFALVGAALTALGILLSRGLIYHLDAIAASIATAAGLDTETAAHIALVFGQPKDAHIVTPWVVLPAGILLGLPASFNNMECTEADLLYLFSRCAADPLDGCRADPDGGKQYPCMGAAGSTASDALCAHIRRSAYAYHYANHCDAGRTLLHAADRRPC